MIEKKALAQPVGGEHHAIGRIGLQDTAQQHRRVGQHLLTPACYTGHAGQRAAAQSGHDTREVPRVTARKTVTLDHPQRIADLVHVDARDVAPSAADRVKAAVTHPFEPVDAGEAAVDLVPYGIVTLFGEFQQAQRAKREGRGPAVRAFGDFDQLEAAAAQVAHHPVGVGYAGEHAQGRDARLLGTADHLHLLPAAALDLGDEILAVLGLAHGRGGQHVDPGHAHAAGHAGKARQVDERQICTRLREPTGRFQSAAQAAKDLLIEQGTEGPRQPVEDFQADRVGADVYDRHAAVSPRRPNLGVLGNRAHGVI